MVLVLIGAVVTAVGLFLPVAEVKSGIHISENSLVHHPEGLIVIGLVVLSVLGALRGGATLPLVSGLVLVGVAVLSGSHVSDLIEITEAGSELLRQTSGTVLGERLSESLEASPGPGIWTIGIGGALIAIGGLCRPD